MRSCHFILIAFITLAFSIVPSLVLAVDSTSISPKSASAVLIKTPYTYLLDSGTTNLLVTMSSLGNYIDSSSTDPNHSYSLSNRGSWSYSGLMQIEGTFPATLLFGGTQYQQQANQPNYPIGYTKKVCQSNSSPFVIVTLRGVDSTFTDTSGNGTCNVKSILLSGGELAGPYDTNRGNTGYMVGLTAFPLIYGEGTGFYGPLDCSQMDHVSVDLSWSIICNPQ